MLIKTNSQLELRKKQRDIVDYVSKSDGESARSRRNIEAFKDYEKVSNKIRGVKSDILPDL